MRLVTAVSAAFGLFFVSSAPAYVYLSGNPRWMQPTLNMYLQFPGPPFVLTDGSVSYYRSFENAYAGNVDPNWRDNVPRIHAVKPQNTFFAGFEMIDKQLVKEDRRKMAICRNDLIQFRI